jgi:uncharacterized NAD-dependent epimerase/dehydratase family protein
VGLAPDGGALSAEARADVLHALKLGLNVDSGLHTFLGDDPEAVGIARAAGVQIRDVRRGPPRSEQHFYTGKIEEVRSIKIAVLGSDSAIGKRTTSWLLVQALEKAGVSVEMVGTGQTAWLQGARYSIMLDSIINDFLTGEIEHAVWSAWNERRPQVIVIEGQGGLMNPAYPGGYEILAAAQPDMVLFQHAPARKIYDGFPQFQMQPLGTQLKVLELMSGRPAAAVCVNHEDLDPGEVPEICRAIAREHGVPACDALLGGADMLAKLVMAKLKSSSAAAA